MSSASISLSKSSTVALIPRVTTSKRVNYSLNTSMRSVVNSQLSHAANPDNALSNQSTSVRNLANSRLVGEMSTGQNSAAQSSVQTSLSAYLQNSGSASNTTFSGSFFDGSA